MSSRLPKAAAVPQENQYVDDPVQALNILAHPLAVYAAVRDPLRRSGRRS